MNLPACTALLFLLLASPSGMAQTIGNKAVSAQSSPNSSRDLDQSPRSETTAGEQRNPDPHIYRLGEHLSEAYGNYDLVDDWAKHQLKKPPDGSHWVRYGQNYLLAKATDGLITQIVAAS